MQRNFLIGICLSVCLFSGCNTVSCERYGSYEHPKFKTKYTIQEHMERLMVRTEEKYAEELESGELLDFRVEILYAFYDNDPEYFLIEYHFADAEIPIEVDGKTERVKKPTYGHMIGMIENDKYKVSMICCDEENYIGSAKKYEQDSMNMRIGQSCYTKCGFEGEKKYYGGSTCAVELDGQIVQIYRRADTEEKSWERRLIPESEQKRLMKQSYHMWADIY